MSKGLQDWITQSEAARVRGVTPAAINALIARGRLTTMEVAGITLVSRTEILNFQKDKPGPKPRYQDAAARRKKAAEPKTRYRRKAAREKTK